MTVHRVIFPAPSRVELEEFAPEAVGDGAVAVRTLYSLMSTGTELTVLNGEYEVGTHWDHWIQFPFSPGYAAVGEVVEVGPGVDDLEVGDRVALRAGHASQHVVSAQLCSLIPAEVDLTTAPWFALAKIALIGARAAAHSLGDSVLVVGAGPIGQMSIRWANAAGVGALGVVDPVGVRLEHARRGGATAVIARPLGEAADMVHAALGPDGPDVVIDSTGNAAVFAAALALVRPRGRVVVLGDTGRPSNQHLTSDVIVKGVTIVGAHDSHSHSNSGWDGDRSLHSLFFHLVATGRFDLRGLNSHTFSPRDCASAYALANERRGDTLGIIFDWESDDVR